MPDTTERLLQPVCDGDTPLVGGDAPLRSPMGGYSPAPYKNFEMNSAGVMGFG